MHPPPYDTIMWGVLCPKRYVASAHQVARGGWELSKLVGTRSTKAPQRQGSLAGPLCFILVCMSCRNREPLTEWLSQQKIVSQF